MLKTGMAGLFYFALAIIVMLSHVEDGNSFAIYINLEQNRLVIGDFFASLFVLWLLFESLFRFIAISKQRWPG